MATSSLKPSVTASSTSPRLSLQSEVIAADSSTIRSLDWERSRFDIEFGLRNGTTYNAFLVRGERTALIDTSHAKFRDTWLPLLKGANRSQADRLPDREPYRTGPLRTDWRPD